MPSSGDLPAPALIPEITLTDHLTRAALAAALAPVTSQLQRDAHHRPLLIDCRRMTGYDADARVLFVQWNTTHKVRIRRVAIVTSNTLWHMVISAMSLASGQEMRAFSDPDLARQWLQPGR